MGASTLQAVLRLFVATIFGLAAGCHLSAGQVGSPPVTTASQAQISPKPVVQQLIIKFRHDTIACDSHGIARLSAAVKVRIEHVRTMSGSACVVRQFADRDGGFAAGQLLMREHPDVEWLELDAIMKHYKESK